jgi:maltose O-acetyltransferase
VLPGITIGAGALIGAGSLVTKDVPPDALAYGHPAQVHGTVSSLAPYRDPSR